MVRALQWRHSLTGSALKHRHRLVDPKLLQSQTQDNGRDNTIYA